MSATLLLVDSHDVEVLCCGRFCPLCHMPVELYGCDDETCNGFDGA